MTAKEARAIVLAQWPQARYMNLSDKRPCHCIDDAHNDRYLAFAEASRDAAWKRAATFALLKSTKVRA